MEKKGKINFSPSPELPGEPRSPWASRLRPTLRRYLSTISRPQLLHTHLPGGQTEPEAMDRGEDDGDSGAEEEHESSSPTPSGLTCRKPRARSQAVLEPSSSRHPTDPRGLPHRLPSLPPSHPQLLMSRSSPSPGSKLPQRSRRGCRPRTSESWGAWRLCPARPRSLPLHRLLEGPVEPGKELGDSSPPFWAAAPRPAPRALPTHQPLFPGAFPSPPSR